MLRHSSTVQNVIGLSGAESEHNALTKGGCSGLGLQSLFANRNLKLQLSLHTESSSAKALTSRRGAGKSTRHIQTRMLLLQERVAAKHLRVVKVATGSNPADIQTQRLVKQNLMRRRWTRNSKEIKKLKKVEFAVEAMVTSAATIKNEPNDEVAMIKNQSKDATLRRMHTMD